MTVTTRPPPARLAIARYRSERMARQYVNTPQKSAHVAGKAVDIFQTDAGRRRRRRRGGKGKRRARVDDRARPAELGLVAVGRVHAPDPDLSPPCEC